MLRVPKSANYLNQCPGISIISKRFKYAASEDYQNNYNHNNYQYMQQSELNTMFFQRSLPRLPIPELEKTCNRFLSAVEPILSSGQYERTSKLVTEFKNGDGSKLDALLRQRDAANKHTSYISEPWFEMYLTDRSPLPLNYNPLIVMENETRDKYRSQIVRATNLVISSLRFWSSLKADLLEPEVYHMNPKKSDTNRFRKIMRLTPNFIATYLAYTFKAFPLDMSQYNSLFGASRIPELNKDRLVKNPESRHILIMRRGNMYSVDVLAEGGSIEPPHVILARLKAVLELDQRREVAQVPLGVFTTSERNEWATIRTHFVNQISEANKQKLETEVDGALFCLCLDDEQDPVYVEADPIPLFKHLLAGHGKNRWFDKSVSLLVSADGTAAINFEHSWGDGVAVLRYFNEIYKETTTTPFVDQELASSTSAADGCKGVRFINFDFDDQIRKAAQKAIETNSMILDTLNMNMLRYPHLNKVTCKRDRLSPDSIMQLSFQLAYYQVFKDFVGSYESCSTAAFRHGRTETMRPCTKATRNFCEAILQSENKRPSANELRAMIDTCSTVHGQLTKEAAMGQGFDRHLFALKYMANLNEMPIPEIYNTEAYSKINYNIISTSTLNSNALLAGAFGPVVRDGLGIGYSIRNEECGAIVTSYKNERDGQQFIDSLEEAFNNILKVISQSKN